jgi:hypothetical protein
LTVGRHRSPLPGTAAKRRRPSGAAAPLRQVLMPGAVGRRRRASSFPSAITDAGGGIPPLVRMLETGSPKAIEDSAITIGKLCIDSEDIRACVESADALSRVTELYWSNHLF